MTKTATKAAHAVRDYLKELGYDVSYKDVVCIDGAMSAHLKPQTNELAAARVEIESLTKELAAAHDKILHLTSPQYVADYEEGRRMREHRERRDAILAGEVAPPLDMKLTDEQHAATQRYAFGGPPPWHAPFVPLDKPEPSS